MTTAFTNSLLPLWGDLEHLPLSGDLKPVKDQIMVRAIFQVKVVKFELFLLARQEEFAAQNCEKGYPILGAMFFSGALKTYHDMAKAIPQA